MVSVGNTAFITPSNFGQQIWSQYGTPIRLICFLRSSLSIIPEKAAPRKACVASETSTRSPSSCSTSSVSMPVAAAVVIDYLLCKVFTCSSSLFICSIICFRSVFVSSDILNNVETSLSARKKAEVGS